jgi:hypothetical protein
MSTITDAVFPGHRPITFATSQPTTRELLPTHPGPLIKQMPLSRSLARPHDPALTFPKKDMEHADLASRLHPYPFTSPSAAAWPVSHIGNVEPEEEPEPEAEADADVRARALERTAAERAFVEEMAELVLPALLTERRRDEMQRKPATAERDRHHGVWGWSGRGRVVMEDQEGRGFDRISPRS